MADNLKRDRAGEPFQDSFTENRGVRRPLIDDAQHDLNLEGDQVSGGDAAEKEASVRRPDRPEKQDQDS
jgi:hypothetical protein